MNTTKYWQATRGKVWIYFQLKWVMGKMILRDRNRKQEGEKCKLKFYSRLFWMQGLHVSHDGRRNSLCCWITLNFWSSCLYFTNTKITAVQYHMYFYASARDQTEALCMLGQHLPNELSLASKVLKLCSIPNYQHRLCILLRSVNIIKTTTRYSSMIKHFPDMCRVLNPILTETKTNAHINKNQGSGWNTTETSVLYPHQSDRKHKN